VPARTLTLLRGYRGEQRPLTLRLLIRQWLAASGYAVRTLSVPLG
jgi:hypothetical protein